MKPSIYPVFAAALEFVKDVKYANKIDVYNQPLVLEVERYKAAFKKHIESLPVTSKKTTYKPKYKPAKQKFYNGDTPPWEDE